MNILFTGLQSWDIDMGSNAKDIAIQMSKQHKVLYINPPMDIVTKLKTKRRIEDNIRQINTNFFVADVNPLLLPVGQIKSDFLFDRLNKLNNRNYAFAIREVLSKVGFTNDFIHFVDNDIYRSFYLKEYLKPRLQIYYRRDYLYTVNYWKCHASRLEPLLASKADIVMANSPYLAQQMECYNKNCYYVGQGVDLTAYNPDKVKARQLPYAKPIIGYAGSITALRLDADLLYEVASLRKDYLFVMVGKEDAFFKSHKLHTLDNMYFTGLVTPEELPEYIAAFDICLNPQLVNDITIGNYPRKIDEYLGMGKQVVATDTPTMKIFEGYVSLCTSATEYANIIDNLMEKGVDKDKLMKFAQSHSWQNSVDTILEIIDTYLNDEGILRTKKSSK